MKPTKYTTIPVMKPMPYHNDPPNAILFLIKLNLKHTYSTFVIKKNYNGEASDPRPEIKESSITKVNTTFSIVIGCNPVHKNGKYKI